MDIGAMRVERKFETVVVVTRWTGAESEMLRLAYNFSVDEFAALVSRSRRQIDIWEVRAETMRLQAASKRELDAALRKAPDDVKERFERLVGDRASSSDVACNQRIEDVEEIVRRREFAAGSVLLAAVAAAVPEVAARLAGDSRARVARISAAPASFGSADLDNVRETLNLAKLRDDRLGPQYAIGAVLEQADLLDSVLNHGTLLADEIYPLRCLAGTSAGWQLYDLGHHTEATTEFRAALNAADEVDDDRSGALALLEHGVMLTETGAVKQGSDKYVAAEARAVRVGSDQNLRAHAASLVAVAAARLTDRPGSLAALRRAGVALEHTSADATPETSVAYFVGPAHVAAHRAKALRQLGDLSGAETAIREALHFTGPRDLPSRFALLGMILVDGGNCDGAADAFVDCAVAAGRGASARTLDKIRAGRTAIHVKAPNSDVARGLDERLNGLGIAV